MLGLPCPCFSDAIPQAVPAVLIASSESVSSRQLLPTQPCGHGGIQGLRRKKPKGKKDAEMKDEVSAAEWKTHEE